MRASRTWTVRLSWGLTMLALVVAPALADDVILSGADLWQTPGEVSYTDFSNEPLPKDFFCPGSQPFSGRIVMTGAPLATEPAGVLGPVDTVVHRLDDATFDADGVAATRLQVMALSLAGTEPLDVGCEQPFELTASLAGEQPLTEMRIKRDADYGGSYVAPLKLNVKVVFTPMDGGGEPLVARREIVLGPASNSYWTTTDQIGTDAFGDPVRLDTDGDGVPDASLPGPSNFVAGMALASTFAIACPAGWCPGECCHCTPRIYNPQWNEPLDNCRRDPDDPTLIDPTHLHCVDCCVPCNVEIEPIEETL